MFLLHKFPFIIVLQAFPKHQYISLTLNPNIQSDIHKGIAEKPSHAIKHIFLFCSILLVVSNILLFCSTLPVVSNMLLSLFFPHYPLFLTVVLFWSILPVVVGGDVDAERDAISGRPERFDFHLSKKMPKQLSLRTLLWSVPRISQKGRKLLRMRLQT